MLQLERPLRQIERTGRHPPNKVPLVAIGLSAAVVAASITWWLPASPGHSHANRIEDARTDRAPITMADVRAAALAPCAAADDPARLRSEAEALIFSATPTVPGLRDPAAGASSSRETDQTAARAELPAEWPPKMALPPKAGDVNPAEIAGWLRMAPETSEPALVTGSIAQAPNLPSSQAPAAARAEPRLRPRPIAKAFKPASPPSTACAVPSRDVVITRAVENMRPPHLE